MRPPRIETPVGAINGVNKTFFVAADYLPGSTRVYLNGVLLLPTLQNGHTELGGRKINLKEAPEMGDVVRVYYIPIG